MYDAFLVWLIEGIREKVKQVLESNETKQFEWKIFSAVKAVPRWEFIAFKLIKCKLERKSERLGRWLSS